MMYDGLTHAGGVVHRQGANGVEHVLLVRASKAPFEWVLPKGHIEHGETPAETAFVRRFVVSPQLARAQQSRRSIEIELDAITAGASPVDARLISTARAFLAQLRRGAVGAQPRWIRVGSGAASALTVAFVGGFSERLIVRVAESIAGKDDSQSSGDTKKNPD